MKWRSVSSRRFHLIKKMPSKFEALFSKLVIVPKGMLPQGKTCFSVGSSPFVPTTQKSNNLCIGILALARLF